MDKSHPSLCIPRVFSNIHWKRVKSVFEELNLGEIDRVDMVNKENAKGEKFKRVFIHFKSWNDTDEAKNVRSKIIDGETVQIIYDEPWFWKVSMSKISKPDFEKVKTRKPHERKPRHQPPKSKKVKDQSDEISELKAMLLSQASQMAQLQKIIMENNTGSVKQTTEDKPQEKPYSPPYTPPYTPPRTPPRSPPYKPTSPIMETPVKLELEKRSVTTPPPAPKKKIIRKKLVKIAT